MTDPALNPMKPTQLVLPLMTDSSAVDEVKVLPEPSSFSNPEPGSTESTDFELTPEVPPDVSNSSNVDALMLPTSTIEMKTNFTVVKPTSEMKINLTVLMPNSTSNARSPQLITKLSDLPSANETKMSPTLTNETAMSSTLIETEMSSTLLANETVMSALVQQTSRQRTFEEHLEDFLRSGLL